MNEEDLMKLKDELNEFKKFNESKLENIKIEKEEVEKKDDEKIEIEKKDSEKKKNIEVKEETKDKKAKKNLNKENLSIKKKKIGFKLMLISMLLLPILQVLFVIGCNSNYLIRKPFFITICILSILLLAALIYGINIFVKNRSANKRRLKKWLKYIFYIFMAFYVIGCVAFCLLLYGPSEKFRTWYITTGMRTMNHQYLVKWFYNEDQINHIMSKNFIRESGESTDKDLIDKEKPQEYNEYEKELLIHDEDEPYKIVTFEVNGAKAYMAAVFDPSKVKLEVTNKIGVIGEYVTKMMERNDALLGINAGGFVDMGNNLGETPTGITIKNKEIIVDGEGSDIYSPGGIIGLTDDDVLVLLKNVSAKEAIEKHGVRDAVTWHPFLIVNGVPSQVSGNGGFGGGARSAIGQRKDGTILFLVVDSNAYRTTGAGMEDLVQIMQRYGAYNAANLDGGTSSVMDVKRQTAIEKYGADCHDYFSQYACHINDPIDSQHIHQTRYIADAWIVVE